MDLTTVHATGDILIVILIGLLSWLGREYVKRLDKHLDECRLRAMTTASNETKLNTLEKEMGSVKTQIHWMGDSMMVMSTKLDVNLPERPR